MFHETKGNIKMKSLLSNRSYKDGKTCFIKTRNAFWVIGSIINTVHFLVETSQTGFMTGHATGSPVILWVQTLRTLFSSFINVLLYYLKIEFFFHVFYVNVTT